jgi:enoyl-CoA hydratase
MHPMIRLEWTADHIALATLDQPDSKVNILSQPMWGELEQMLTQLHARAETAGLLLASAKPGIFVAGADLNELGKAGPVDPATTRALVARGLAVLAGLEALPFPTVALIDGACLGGGLELALACDARLLGSHPRAELGFPEVKIGLIPGWGGTQRLPRLIGPIAALDLILSAEPIRAPRAVELGLAHATVPSEQLLARGQQLLRELAASDAWRAARQRKQAALLMSADERDFAFSTYQAQHAHRLKLPAATSRPDRHRSRDRPAARRGTARSRARRSSASPAATSPATSSRCSSPRKKCRSYRYQPLPPRSSKSASSARARWARASPRRA